MYKRTIISVAVILLLIGGIIVLTNNKNTENSEEIKMKPSIEEEIILNILKEQGLTAKNIEFNKRETRSQGYIELECQNNLTFEEDEEIIKKLAAALKEAFPNEIGENSTRDSWFDVSSCSQIGISPDGVNMYYSTSMWIIDREVYDLRI